MLCLPRASSASVASAAGNHRQKLPQVTDAAKKNKIKSLKTLNLAYSESKTPR